VPECLSITARILYRQFMYDTTLPLIGGGNMARPDRRPDCRRLGSATHYRIRSRLSPAEQLREHFGVVTTGQPGGRDWLIVLLAVKPQIVRGRPSWLNCCRASTTGHSIAAGIRTDALRNWTGYTPRSCAACPRRHWCRAANRTVRKCRRYHAATRCRGNHPACRGLTIWLRMSPDGCCDSTVRQRPAYFLFMEALQRPVAHLACRNRQRPQILQTALGQR
jgi:hypothetical protein